MHPVFLDLRKLLLYLLACLLAGILFAGLLQFSGLADWPQGLLFSLPLSLLYGFIALSAYYVCRAQPFAQRRLAAACGLLGGATLVAACSWLLLALIWNMAGRLFGLQSGWVPLTANLQLILFLAGAGLFLVSILAHEVLIAFENLRVAMEQEAQSRLLARDAELRMLRSQIDPHFLFNSLNSISALTSIDPAAARAMTIDLAQFFRLTLALSERDTITLAEEMTLCEHYLAIEKRRFGAKLNIVFQTDPAALACELPPLTLQPLLENALKHGIRLLDEGGTVVLEALCSGGWLHIAISNPVAESSKMISDSGLGLKNGRARLLLRYGDRARMTLQSTALQFRVELAIPQDAKA